MKSLLTFLLTLSVAFGFAYTTNQGQESNGQRKEKPNIVLILADDLGIGDISGLNPNSKISTPNIDKLIANGMTFTDAHASASVSTPARYALLTGQYAWRTTLKKGSLNGYSKSLIADTTDTAPALLKRSGYKTALIGNWHLGLNWALNDTNVHQISSENQIDFSRPFTGGPLDHGFDYFYGISAEPDYPPYVYCENNRVTQLPTAFFPGKGGNSKKDLSENQQRQRKGKMAPGYDAQKTLKIITERSVNYIEEQHDGNPFFLMVSLTTPHTPVLPRKEFAATSNAGVYGDFVQEMDWSVGQIIQAMKKKGLNKNTIIIFTADNGASRISFPLAYEKKFDHYPSRELHGRKGTLHEGGHHIPFIVQWKGIILSNSKCNNAICLSDIYATFADLTGTALAANQGVDSYSLKSLLTGQDTYQRKSTVYTNSAGRFSIRKGNWKLDLNPKPENRKLYNIIDDRGEKHNLYGDKSYSNIEKELMQEISSIILNGRSTSGPVIKTGNLWPQVYWLKKSNLK